MLLLWLLVGLLMCNVESAVQNVTCPRVNPRELNWKELDGKWYVAAVASDTKIVADCTMLMFNHMNSTDVSISWIANNTMFYHNGSVSIIVDPNSNSSNMGDLLQVTYADQPPEKYSFLTVDYEHYAALFACYNNSDGNSSTYEIWKLTRTSHLKESDAAKLDQAIANYSLQDTVFTTFNNTEYTCSVNAGSQLTHSFIVSVIAFMVLRSLYF